MGQQQSIDRLSQGMLKWQYLIGAVNGRLPNRYDPT